MAKPIQYCKIKKIIKKLKKIFFFSVTAPFYLEDSRRIQDSKRREWRSTQGRERVREGERGREKESAHTRGRERDEKALWLLLLYVFSSTWACPMQNGLSQECCLFCLKSSLWSSDLPLTFLCSIFAGFSLPCLLATTILDSFFYSNYSKTSARKVSQITLRFVFGLLPLLLKVSEFQRVCMSSFGSLTFLRRNTQKVRK